MMNDQRKWAQEEKWNMKVLICFVRDPEFKNQPSYNLTYSYQQQCKLQKVHKSQMLMGFCELHVCFRLELGLTGEQVIHQN